MNTSACKSQSKWIDRELIRIEIDKGVYHSLKLLNEGLVCRSVDSNIVRIVEFFPIIELDFNALGKLQNFVFSEQNLMKDTTVDAPTIKIFDECSWIKYSLIYENEFYVTYWIDGKCQYLEKCLNLMNNIIPADKRKLYEIKPR